MCGRPVDLDVRVYALFVAKSKRSFWHRGRWGVYHVWGQRITSQVRKLAALIIFSVTEIFSCWPCKMET